MSLQLIIGVTAKPGLDSWTGLVDWTLDWTHGLTHCGHYAVAITFLSIVCPFPDEKFNIYSEHHLVVPSCHIVEHILPSICLEKYVKCEQFT